MLIIANTAYSQTLNQNLSKYLNTYLEAKKIPSVSAAAAVNNKLIWTDACGYTDIENSVKATPKSIYRIASISKPITAVAVMQLVEKGLIKLDDPITKYVPYFPKKKWDVTVREILTHTSGIRTYREGEFDNKNHYPMLKDAIMVYAMDTLETRPGTKYNYNSIAYNLLAAAIEDVTKLSFEAYLKKHIFEPAGMHNTDLEFQSEIVPNRAHGYVKNNDTITNAPLADLSFKYAGGGIISTAEDLVRFGLALLNNKLISKASLDTMIRPTVLPSGQRIDYGFGFGVGVDSSRGKYFTHAGGGTGFASNIVIYPASQSVFVHLVNVRDANLENPSLDIASIVLGNGSAAYDKLIQKYAHKK